MNELERKMEIQKDGSFGAVSIGVNYWASHAGIFMWQKWRPDVVEADFANLAEQGMEVLRVFPLWPDFQPVNNLRKWHATHVEYRNGEELLQRPDGLAEEMLERFSFVANCAAKHGLKLVVGLITGWMSGRLFVPPALEGLNPITDPEVVKWQLRFVHGIVDRFRSESSIVAWDLGNECNCMGKVTSEEESWAWTASIANAIRAVDPSRPIISGMHSLKADPKMPWSIRAQGELTDVLTVHPYPLFTPHCLREPLNTMRPLLHIAAESCFYSDLSGSPVIVEEFGTLGPTVCDSKVAAQLARVSVYDCWAHGVGSALWWCAYDQNELEEAPYDWLSIERELGLFKPNREPKPEALALASARQEIRDASSGIERLPSRKVEAVCLLTPGQDQWGAGFSAFVLAKQAGFDLRFHYSDQPLPDAPLYILPSVHNKAPLSRHRERELWEKIESGAVLYHSVALIGLAETNQRAGFDLIRHSERANTCSFSYGGQSFTVDSPMRFDLNLHSGTEILASEEDGSPIFLRCPQGEGEVYTLLFPLETFLANSAEVFLPGREPDYWKLYRKFSQRFIDRRVIRKESPWIGVTEHFLKNGDLLAILTNYSSDPVQTSLQIAPGWERDLSDGIDVEFDPCSSQLWRLKQETSKVGEDCGAFEPGVARAG
ncbi:cellulase family glycosylhydrolase [Puniceicoccus vermicola]|uniref:mannan endo-1,4-beta-mannosidase n=1 Tax=Puniceicoccus vermicola TaxID=388746 RepID=A0A7X1E4Z8_9BACT|nr:cellulase family glycosylhydrolase [Puniceicoccus vermicola]MBC2602646.1 cellulase family glycosylhydrolase [Puniceicoccus vermicola]